jgi:hypothetical protein
MAYLSDTGKGMSPMEKAAMICRLRKPEAEGGRGWATRADNAKIAAWMGIQP